MTSNKIELRAEHITYLKSVMLFVCSFVSILSAILLYFFITIGELPTLVVNGYFFSLVISLPFSMFSGFLFWRSRNIEREKLWGVDGNVIRILKYDKIVEEIPWNLVRHIRYKKGKLTMIADIGCERFFIRGIRRTHFNEFKKFGEKSMNGVEKSQIRGD